jgi:hypothetical protein
MVGVFSFNGHLLYVCASFVENLILELMSKLQNFVCLEFTRFQGMNHTLIRKDLEVVLSKF